MGSATCLVRRRLLGRGFRPRHGEVAEGQLELAGIQAGACGGPVAGRELEVPVGGPVSQDADKVAEVELGVEPVELARADQREEVGGGLGVVVAADEEPSVSTDGKPRVILPVSRFAPRSTTRGTQPEAARSRSTTARSAAAKRFSCARSPTMRAS